MTKKMDALTPGSGEWRGTKSDGIERISALLLAGEHAEADAEVKSLAKLLGTSPAALREELPRMESGGGQDQPKRMGLYDPAPVPAEKRKPLADLLDIMVRLIRTRVRLPAEAAAAVTLWCAGAWGCRPLRSMGGDAGGNAEIKPGPDIFPRLAIGSPTKGCGKSTLLDTVLHLVPRPIRVDDLTEATLFRSVEAHFPTLLLDEFDVLQRKVPTIRGLLNSGFARTGSVMRTMEVAGRAKGTRDFEPVPFATFAPTLISGIGSLPDTTASRSVRVILQKKPAGASGKRLRSRDMLKMRDAIGPHLAAWADVLALAMAKGLPDAELPAELGDRAADCWEPLICVARLAGPEWEARARQAAVALTDTAPEASGPEKRLADIWAAARELRAERVTARAAARQARKASTGGPPPRRILPPLRFVPASDLAVRLRDMPDSLAADTVSEQAAKAAVARALKGFDIYPIRGRALPGAAQAERGYRLAEIRRAWAIYGPPPGAWRG